MSLVVAVFVPSGIVLAADSRTTATLTQHTPDPTDRSRQHTSQTQLVVSDAAHKLFLLHDRVGVGVFGDALVQQLPIAHYLAQFAATVPAPASPDVAGTARALLSCFRALEPVPDLGLIVAGYQGTEPWVLSVGVRAPSQQRMNQRDGQLVYGVLRGGDTAVVDRLLSQEGFNPQFPLMPVQDAVDFGRHLIRTTIDQLRFEPRFPTVGGPIDTLVLQPERAHFLTQKVLHVS